MTLTLAILRWRRAPGVEWPQLRLLGPFCALLLFGVAFAPANLAAAPAEAGAPAWRDSSVEPVLLEVGHLLVSGRKEEAVARAEAGLEAFRGSGDLRGQGTCLALLAVFDTRAIATGETVERLERGFVLLVESRHPFAAAAVARFLGRIHLGYGGHDKAEAFLRRSLELLEAYRRSGDPLPVVDYWIFASMLDLPPDVSMVPDPLSAETRAWLLRQADSAIRDTLGSVLTWSNRFDEAETELERALALVSSAEPAAVARTLENLAILRQRQERFDEARELLLRLLRETTDEDRRVKYFKALGAFELGSGDLAGALERNACDLAAAEERGDRLAVAMLLRSRARLLEESGTLEKARQLYDRAREMAAEGGHAYAEAQVLLGRANLALKTGAHELAASALERALPHLRSAGDRLSERNAWLLLIAAYQGLGAHERAARAVAAAVEIGRTMHDPVGRDTARAFEELHRWRRGEEGMSEIIQLARTAMADPIQTTTGRRAPEAVLMALGLVAEGAPPEKSAKALELALDRAEEEMDVRVQAQGRALLGYLYRLQASNGRVRSEWKKALELARSIEQHQLVAQLLGMLAELAWDEDRRGEAVDLALESVAAFERTVTGVRTDALLTSFLGDNTAIYTRAISGLIETGQVEDAFLYSERARARALLQLLGNQRLGPRPGEDAEVVAELEEARARLRELQDPASAEGSSSRELAKARRRFEDLLVRSQVVAPGYTELVRVTPLDLQELQTEILGEDTALVSFFLLGDRVVAWVVDGEDVAFTPTSLSASDLDRVACLGERFVEEGRGRGAERIGPCTSGDLAAELYRKLMAPVMPFVHHRRLVLVPHDALHRLPFAALRNPATGRYLVEDHTLTLAPSASVFGVLRRQENPWTGRALVLGDPALPPKDLGPLPGARREAEAVAAVLGTEALLGNDATETRLRQAAAGADLVHLAAHGVYEPEHPLFSRIALAADMHHDGRLEMHEVFGELDLSEANLVVLSGCRTALGERTGGDEIVGLIRAFLYAGSPAVLATLWSIDDETSAGLMEAFYRRVLDGEPAAEALRQAQIETLRREDTAAPYYWAGFTLVGDPRSVVRGKPTP